VHDAARRLECSLLQVEVQLVANVAPREARVLRAGGGGGRVGAARRYGGEVGGRTLRWRGVGREGSEAERCRGGGVGVGGVAGWRSAGRRERGLEQR
jgi:hypothetical protein